MTPGQTSPTVRVMNEDLESLLPWWTFEVRMPNGEPADAISLDRVMPDGDPSRVMLKGTAGIFRIAAQPGAAPQCYWIEANDCLRQKVPPLEAGAMVQLKPLVQVQLQLVGAALPSGPFEAAAMPQDASFPAPARVPLAFDASGQASALFDGTGTYDLMGFEGPADTLNGARPWRYASFEVPADGGSVAIPVRHE